MDTYYNADYDYNYSYVGDFYDGQMVEELLRRKEAERMFHRLFFYTAPFLLFLGISGNLFSFAVLQSAHFRQCPCSFILRALALTDVAVLCTGLLRHWIGAIEYEISDGERMTDIRNVSAFSCKTHIFLTYWLPQLSAWTLVLVTIERLLSVSNPLTATRVCSKSRMKVAWAIIGVCLAVINSHAFKTQAIHDYSAVYNNVTYPKFECHFAIEDEHFVKDVWSWMDFLLSCLLPAAIIAATNVAIVRKLAGARVARKTDMRVSSSETGKKSRSLSAMLVGISVLFLVTTLPVNIFLIGNSRWPDDTPERHYIKQVAYALTNLLFYTNNATNFVIYCVTGSRFRAAVAAMICLRMPGCARRYGAKKGERRSVFRRGANTEL